MSWTKWDIKKILEQPFIPMMLCLEHAISYNTINSDSNQTQSGSPVAFDMRKMKDMQQVISSGSK